MMDTDDIVDLLTIVAVADKRTIGQADVILWQKILTHPTDQLKRDECTDAIMAFRREQPGDWIEPGHIVKRVRTARNDRYERAGTTRKPPENPALTAAHTRGTHIRTDPAGWSYGAGTLTENEARTELKTRINQHHRDHPHSSRADAETAIRRADRARAEKLLNNVGRTELAAYLAGPRLSDADEPEVLSFSEPLRGRTP